MERKLLDKKITTHLVRANTDRRRARCISHNVRADFLCNGIYESVYITPGITSFDIDLNVALVTRHLLHVSIILFSVPV